MAEGKTRYHVFLSHNSRDKGAVEPLARKLREEGLNPFLDKWNLVPGEPIEDALIEALENSDSAAIFVGPEGEGPWQSEEMRDILKRAVKSHNEFRAIPVLLPDASAEALERSFLGSRLWVEFKDVDDDDALLRLAKAIQGEAYGDETFKLPDEPAPYRGLERFERIEKPEEDFFFGRDDEVRALVGRLVQDRFVAVVGASGSGKSSLIRAGLTKQLAEELHPGIRRWQAITVEPGSAPFRALAVQVAVTAGIPVAEREDWIEKSVQKWRASPDGVRTSIETIFADVKEPLLMFIDQFEELFTHGKKNEESERISRNFVANLDDLWRNGGDRLCVVVAMRADFIDRCLEIGALKELLQDRTMLIGEVGDDALREIVKEPAARVGAFLEKGLMERILTDVHDQSGSLPLLEQALYELWRQRRGAWLTHEAYDDSGGVAGALNDQAQGAYKALDDAQKKIADSLFPRLITLGEGVADTRRRVKRNELYPEGVEPDAVNAVIDKLTARDARILVTTREGGTAEDLGAGEDFVEFTHEALLGNWQHLASLLASERESIRKHRVLTTAAEEWESKPKDEGEKFLLRAGQLVIAEQWATDEGGYARLNQLERRFLDESIQERIADEARKARTLRRLWSLTSVALTLAVVAGVFFYNAQVAEKLAQVRELSTRAVVAGQLPSPASGFLDTALLLASQAINQDDSPETRAGLQHLLLTNPSMQILHYKNAKTVRDVSVAIPAKLMATASWDRSVRIWKMDTGEPVSNPITFEKFPNSVALCPSGDVVAAGLSRGRIAVWKTAKPEAITWLDGEGRHTGTVMALDFSPGCDHLASGSRDKRVLVWDMASRKVIANLHGHTNEVWGVEFSPDGKRVVSASDDKSIRVWDLETKRKEVVPNAHDGFVNDVAWSAKNVIASGGADRVVRLWDAKTLKPIGDPLRGHEASVLGVSFSLDGSRLASAARDKTIHVWDVDKRSLIRQPLGGHGGEVWEAAFTDPDGKQLVSVSTGLPVILWDLQRPSALTKELDVGLEQVYRVAFHSDGSILVSKSQNGVGIWDIGKGTRTLLDNGWSYRGKQSVTKSGRVCQKWTAQTPHKHDRTPEEYPEAGLGDHNYCRNPDGEPYAWCYTTDRDRRFEECDIGIAPLTSAEGKLLDIIKADGKLLDIVKDDAVFSPGGLKAVAKGSDVLLWRADEYDNPPRRLSCDSAGRPAFSLDGRWLASGCDKHIKVWENIAGKLTEVQSLDADTKIRQVTFSPKGTWLAGAGEDGTIRLWSVAGWKRADPPLRGHTWIVNSVAFNPSDDNQLVSASHDFSLVLWDAEKGLPIGYPLQGHGDYVFDVVYSPDGSRLASAGRDGKIILWDIDPENWKRIAGHMAGRNMTRDEWRRYMGDTSFLKTFPQHPAGD
jgi:WD40 repeat protein